MSTVDCAVITNLGHALLGKVLAGKSGIHFTRASVGEGVISEGKSPEELTELVHEIKAGDISGVDNPGSGEVRVSIQVSSLGVSVGFFVKEIGIFATDPDLGEILYAYVGMPDKPQWIRPEGASINTLAIFDVYVAVSRAAEVTAQICPSAMVHISDFESYKTYVESQLSNKAALSEFKTLQSDYYAGAVITEFSSPRQLPHAGLYHIAAMTAEVNAHLDDAAHSMTDYNTGDFYAQLLTSFGAEHGGCTFGTLIVTSPRLAKKVWVARIWEYEIKEWVLLAHASAPQRFDLTLHNELLGHAKYSKDQFGMVWLDFNIYKSETEDHISHNILVSYLPEGFRPKDNTLIPVWVGKGEGDNTKMMGNLILYPSGEIWFYVGYGIEVRSFAAQCGFYI